MEDLRVVGPLARKGEEGGRLPFDFRPEGVQTRREQTRDS